MNGKTILVVEDNPLNRQLVSDLLELAGARVLGAADAEAGIEMLGHESVDMVLMDVSLPTMDGLEATRRLKQNPATAHLPVIALTAHAMKGDRDRVMRAGCDGYVTKPIDTRSFVETLKTFLVVAPAKTASKS